MASKTFPVFELTRRQARRKVITTRTVPNKNVSSKPDINGGTFGMPKTFLLAWRLVSSKTGKVFEAISDDEIAAQSLGYDTFKYKMMVMGISGAIAGVSGVYYVHFLRFVDPSFFALPEVIFAVAILIIGGLGSLLGSVLGASVVVIAYETIKYLPLPLEVLGAFRIILFGLIVLLVLLLRPK